MQFNTHFMMTPQVFKYDGKPGGQYALIIYYNITFSQQFIKIVPNELDLHEWQKDDWS